MQQSSRWVALREPPCAMPSQRVFRRRKRPWPIRPPVETRGPERLPGRAIPRTSRLRSSPRSTRALGRVAGNSRVRQVGATRADASRCVVRVLWRGRRAASPCARRRRATRLRAHLRPCSCNESRDARTTIHRSRSLEDGAHRFSQLRIKLGMLTHRAFPPVVVATLGDLPCLAEHADGIFFSMGFQELVSPTWPRLQRGTVC